MKLGTMQSIVSKEPATAAELEGSLDDGSTMDSEFGQDDSEFVDDEEFGAEDDFTENPLAQKLMALRSEIDTILADMGEVSSDFEDGVDYSPEFDPEYMDYEAEDFEDGSDDEDMSEFGFDDETSEVDGAEGFDDQFGDEESNGEFDETDGMDGGEFGSEDEDIGDQNFQGNIRTVTGANLVYKRKQEDGNFEELWIYNIGDDVKQEFQIRRAILAGTDIAPNQKESEDGSQRENTYSLGNVQYLKIDGLPN